MKDVSKTEFEVLEVLWDNAPATAQAIITRLSENKTWHEKTVKTLLSRLVKKEVIGFKKQQRSYLYYPLIARDDYVAKESESMMSRLFNGRLAPLVAGFANQQNLSKEDIDELKQLIQRWENKND